MYLHQGKGLWNSWCRCKTLLTLTLLKCTELENISVLYVTCYVTYSFILLFCLLLWCRVRVILFLCWNCASCCLFKLSCNFFLYFFFHPSQHCVVIENSQTVTLNAPKGSATMKSSEKGIGMSLHKFSFSQVSNVWHFSPVYLAVWTCSRGLCTQLFLKHSGWFFSFWLFRFLGQGWHSLSYLNKPSKAKCMISWTGRMHWFSAMA